MHVFDLSGGHLALDFANSLSGTRAHPTEHLFDYADLLGWGQQAGAVDRSLARRLSTAAARRPPEAERAFGRAIDLREAIFRAFDARAARRREPADALAVIDRETRIAAAHRGIRLRDGELGYAWDDGDALDRPIWPIALAASELLLSPAQPIVKECSSETCDWLFIDRSRNRSRRWCDMRECGNRAKVRRFYERHRGKRSTR